MLMSMVMMLGVHGLRWDSKSIGSVCTLGWDAMKALMLGR